MRENIVGTNWAWVQRWRSIRLERTRRVERLHHDDRAADALHERGKRQGRRVIEGSWGEIDGVFVEREEPLERNLAPDRGRRYSRRRADVKCPWVARSCPSCRASSHPEAARAGAQSISPRLPPRRARTRERHRRPSSDAGKWERLRASRPPRPQAHSRSRRRRPRNRPRCRPASSPVR